MGTTPAGNDSVHLSRRELEIARLVAEGLTNREIAGRLYISERTVDGHLEHVREKLEVNSRAQVAAWVTRQAEAPPAAPADAQPSPGVTRRRVRISKRWWLALSAVVLVVVEAVVVLQVIALVTWLTFHGVLLYPASPCVPSCGQPGCWIGA